MLDALGVGRVVAQEEQAPLYVPELRVHRRLLHRRRTHRRLLHRRRTHRRLLHRRRAYRLLLPLLHLLLLERPLLLNHLPLLLLPPLPLLLLLLLERPLLLHCLLLLLLLLERSLPLYHLLLPLLLHRLLLLLVYRLQLDRLLLMERKLWLRYHQWRHRLLPWHRPLWQRALRIAAEDGRRSCSSPRGGTIGPAAQGRHRGEALCHFIVRRNPRNEDSENLRLLISAGGRGCRNFSAKREPLPSPTVEAFMSPYLCLLPVSREFPSLGNRCRRASLTVLSPHGTS